MRETADNHEAFTRLRVQFAHHEGSYALMKSGMIIDFYPDRQSALLAGHERFIDRLFSVHRVLPHERRRGGERHSPLQPRQSNLDQPPATRPSGR